MAKTAKLSNGAAAKKPQEAGGDTWVLLLLGTTLVVLGAYVYQEFTTLPPSQVASDDLVNDDEPLDSLEDLPEAVEPKRPLPPTVPAGGSWHIENVHAGGGRHEKAPMRNPFALHIPHVTVKELAINKTLRTGHWPFVLTDAMQGKWRATNWTLNLLTNKIPFEWVDYYPENMRDLDNKPFLLHLSEAVPQFKERTGKPKYMQMRISLRGWKRLRKDIEPMPSAPNFWSDDTWIRHCMKTKDGKPDEDAISNFYTTNQWKFLLIGEKGTQMFFHKDHTAASSWQAMLQGRKKWTLCPNTESKYLTTAMDTYNPDYNKYPMFAKALCGQTTVSPGELVYYPAYWWHHTLQLDTPSIAYTGALVGTEAAYPNKRALDTTTKAHQAFYDDLMGKCAKCWTKGKKDRHCDDISLKWPGAAPPPLRRVCDKYLPKCFNLWDEHARTLEMTANIADAADIADTDSSDVGTFE